MLQLITNVLKLYQLIRLGRSLKMSSIPYSIEEVIRLFHKYNIYIVKRRDFKNQDFLNSVSKLPIDAAEFIRNELTEEDCVHSLIRDRDYPNNYLYVFKAIFAGRYCYIKLAVVDRLKCIKVISFHEDEVEKNEKD